MIFDLLPSYIDGLTGKETNAIIENHLETCPECRAAYEAMRQQSMETVIAQSSPADDAKVRYLKRIKKRHRLTILGVVAVLLVLTITAYYFISVRVYPFPVENMQVGNVYLLESGGLYFEVQMDGKSAAKLTGLRQFSYQTEYTVSEDDTKATNFPDVLQFEFQLGYKLIDLWMTKDTMESGLFYFFVDEQLLQNVDSIYFRGLGGSDCLLLWQHGDQVMPAPEDIEEKVATHGNTAFGSEFVVSEGND